MFLRRQYSVGEVRKDGLKYYQVFCLKDWGETERQNGLIGVSRVFRNREDAERFMASLNATQEIRAKRFVIEQKRKRQNREKYLKNTDYY